MPRQAPTAHPFEVLINSIVDEIATRLRARLDETVARAAPGVRRARTGRRGGARDMSCRVKGCTNRSKGPRFGFMCEEHRKSLSKKQQRQAREAWNARRA
jgi:hypothetical protein